MPGNIKVRIYDIQNRYKYKIFCSGTPYDDTEIKEDIADLEANKIDKTQKGAVNGVAELNEAGKVPSSQLPSYIDDVVEGYYYNNKFYEEAAHTTEITAEKGKIYVDLSTEKTYRYSGSLYIEVSPSLELGETQFTAYRGDRGKTAYDHATDSNKVSSTKTEKLYKVGVTNQGHIASATEVSKSDITGLGIQAEINANNKVNADYIDDSTSDHKFTSSTEKNKLSGIESGAEVNKIGSISINNTPINPDSNKNVDLTSALESIILGTDIETGIKNYFALTRDEKTYSVEWYPFATDTGTTMTKTDDNANLVCNPSTDTVSGTNNYPTAFDTIDVNAFVDSEGIRHVTFARGQEGFGETEDTIQDVIYKGVTYKQDVFVLGRTYYQKLEYNSVSGKNKYSRRYVPTNGYTPVSMAINKDGTVNPFWLIAKYESGLDSDGKLRSLKGLLPAGQRNTPVGSCSTSVLNSYNNQITNYHNRGTYYTGMLASEWSHLMTTFWLKYATKDFQSKMAGCTGYDYQYTVAATESNVSRVKLTTAQANNLVIGSSLSVGDNSVTPTTYDRVNGYVHKYADSAVITSIEVDPNDNTYSYVNLDCSPFTTTATTFVKTMPWRSGFSTNLLGRDGSPNNLTNSKNPASLDGIEFMVGAYDVIGNVIASYDSTEKVYDYYVCNDSTKLTTDTSNLSNYIHSSVKTNCTTNNAWNYIADVDLDLTSGLCIGSNVGGTNTSSSRGFCDGYYVSSASGFRELRAFGHLDAWASAGVSCVHGDSALSAAGWACLSRLSINALGGS